MLAEESALAGKFFVSKEQKVTDPSQEQLLLHPTVGRYVPWERRVARCEVRTNPRARYVCS
jgi:hypothetical protein